MTLTADDITTALLTALQQQHLPAKLQGAIPALAQVLADALTAETTSAPLSAEAQQEAQAALQAHLTADPNLTAALRALAGREVNAGGDSVISFGAGAQMGDVSIGDVAGRDVVKIHLDVHQVIYAAPMRSPQEQRNRRAMLRKVEDYWLKGVLDQSLYGTERIEVEMSTAISAVERPLEALIGQPENTFAPIPLGKPIIEIFDEFSALLILGKPGSGKTTLLLELTHDLIVRAHQNDAERIPVVVNLSTWATNPQPLVDWLKLQLHESYNVPYLVAEEWVEKQEVIPLLDGLDEVAVEYRAECAAAINIFLKKEYGLVPIAVCCREDDYAMLPVKLYLRQAIAIHLLDREQIDRFIGRASSVFSSLRIALHDDVTLYEVITTPLTLSIAARAFEDRQKVGILGDGTVEQRRSQLFNVYIQSMFRRLGRSLGRSKHPSKQTTCWLSSLANQMDAHELSKYEIENMQPDWLPKELQIAYTTISVVFGALFGALFGMLSGGLGNAIVFGIGGGVVGQMGSIMIFPIGNYTWSWSAVRDKLSFWISSGLIFGLAGGLGGGLIKGIISGLFGVLMGIVLGGLVGGMEIKEIEVKMRPNQGFNDSMYYACIIGLIYGVVFGIGGVLGSGLIRGIFFGLCGGLIGWLSYGGAATIYHYTLRYLLFRANQLPLFDLIPWLDYCVDRLFLYRVGGGYIFIHRLLMEHFAAMTDEDIARLSDEIAGQSRGQQGRAR